MNDLLIRARQAALRRHKRVQRDGGWCEPDCEFHRNKTPEDHWATHIGGWTWMYCDTVDRFAKEGVWE